LPCPLITYKKECLVLLDWSAKRDAPLVLLQHRARRAGFVQEKTVRIQRVVPEVVEESAAKLVCTAARHYINTGTRISTGLRVVQTRLDLELLDHFRGWNGRAVRSHSILL